ncbi:hypothetical protein [Pedococcus sp. 5OH_020]|uniref:hypothetical protein n=1 Tax=Pedococcus sp. 5OH_020 TaxID=2989814 RepID=UPI0022EA00E0|nr:hypothetical protein [Pedococcus sp. 5OH_020]
MTAGPSTDTVASAAPRRRTGAVGHLWKSPIAILLVVAFMAWQATLGADAFWVVALGRHILRTGSIPEGIPFATADSTGWHNVPVLAELVFALATAPGDRGLAYLQLVLGGGALLLLGATALRRGASDGKMARVILLTALMSLPALVVIRLQMLSVLPFAVLMAVITGEARRPSRRAWWVPAIVALWSNLHGAVLVGVAVTGCYLVVERLPRRPAESVALGAATIGALFLTPAGPRTLHYYLGVLSNQAAQRGSELWAAPDLTRPLDAVMVAAGVVLLVLVLRRRRAAWEYAAVGSLSLATVLAARNGVWLAFASFLLAASPDLRLAPSGARSDEGQQPRTDATPGLRHPDVTARPALRHWAVTGLVAVALSASIIAAKPLVAGFVPADVSRAVEAQVVGQGVVLASEPAVEQLAADGITVWLSDPIDAFHPADQATYLDFLLGLPSGRRALDHVDVVLVDRSRPAHRLMVGQPGWRSTGVMGQWEVFTRDTPR